MRKRKITEYDDETGQVFYDKEIEIREDSQKVLVSSNRRFVKVFATMKMNYNSSMYLGYFHNLLKLLERHTNRIVFHKKGENVALMRHDIAKYLDVSSVTVWKFLSESIRKGYIVVAKMHSSREAFYVNPVFAMNGSGCYTETYLLFEGEREIEMQINEEDRKRINEYLAVRKK